MHYLFDDVRKIGSYFICEFIHSKLHLLLLLELHRVMLNDEAIIG